MSRRLASVSQCVRVLLVDDDRSSFVLTRLQLSKIGGGRFRLDWCGTYEDGFARLRAGGHDVYLLDYHLGARTGLEFLREALALGCTRPIIMLTAENPAVDAEAMRLGAADFLNKEKLDAAILERSIRYSLRHFHTMEALRERDAQMNAFMRNVPCAVYLKDLKGRYVYANEACGELFHRPSAQISGQTDGTLLPRSAAAEVRRLEHKVASANQPVATTESFAGRDGPRYWLVHRFPICGSDGKPVMVGGAAIDITENKRLEREIQNVSEQEKRRIGQDLHDGLGQYLTGIACMVKVVEQKLGAGRSVEASEVQPITALVNDTIVQARDLARGLCPVELESGGLAVALGELARRTERAKVRCTLSARGTLPSLDNDTAIHLYRIAQEGVNNALKHGQPQRIRIALQSGKSRLSLTIDDDGLGLPAAGGLEGGMGLRVMRYRAKLIGATISLGKRTPRGTTLHCTMDPRRAD
jgi:PAS domain S-box-containing protein